MCLEPTWQRNGIIGCTLFQMACPTSPKTLIFAIPYSTFCIFAFFVVDASWNDFASNFASISAPFGSLLVAFSSKKPLQKSLQNLMSFLLQFWLDFGSLLPPFGASVARFERPLGCQNGVLVLTVDTFFRFITHVSAKLRHRPPKVRPKTLQDPPKTPQVRPKTLQNAPRHSPAMHPSVPNTGASRCPASP